MNVLSEYEQELAHALRRLPKAERHAVIDEVRSHLMDAAARIQADESGPSPDEAMLQATHRFGTPQEVAAGYLPQTGEIRVGNVVLRAAISTGRSLGHFAKWTVIAVVVLGGLAAAALALDLVQESRQPHEVRTEQLAHFMKSCGATSLCAGPTDAASFDLGPPKTKFDITAQASCTSGSARIQAVDPSGDTVVLIDDVCRSNHGSAGFTETGRWKIQVVYTGFQGWIYVSAWGYEIR